MSDDDAVRRALARLARTDELSPSNPERQSNPEGNPSADQGPSFRETIERASAAIEDIEAAAYFIEEVGLDELERAVEHADRSVSACASDGRRTLAAFRDLRNAAVGEQFHSGRGTSLGRGDIAQSK